MDSLTIQNTVTDIYLRQQELFSEDYYDKSAMIIGLGGIGSWVAIDLALLGVGTLILIDPDAVEATNLNRTLFKLDDIGSKKVHAIREMISEIRKEVIVLSLAEYFKAEHIKEFDVDYIFDCTDNLNSREIIKNNMPIPSINYVKCGYNGYSATISINDFSSGSWGEGGSYTVVPSFFGTPQIISALVVIEMMINENYEERTINYETHEILQKLNSKEVINEGQPEAEPEQN